MRFFFYGTLGEGMDNPVIRAIRPKLMPGRAARVRGVLDAIPDRNGWYPALTPADDGPQVRGMVYETGLAFTADDLAALDAYEAYDPTDEPGSQYVRRPIEATCDDGDTVRAEVYVFNAALPADARRIEQPSFAAFLAAHGLKALAPRDPKSCCIHARVSDRTGRSEEVAVMPNSVRAASVGAILALSMLSSPLGAAGGGGGGFGGSSPSDSAPRYDPAVEYQKGLAALQASKYADAKRSFDRVLVAAPKDANTAYLAGLASDGLGKPKDARKYYEKALKSDKDHVDARRALALALVKLGEAGMAQAELDKLKSAATVCASACANAAKLDAAVQAVGAALAGQQATLAPLPQAAGAAGDLVYGEAVALINLRRYDAALGSLYRAAETFGPHPDVLTYLGYANRKLGRPNRAEDYYRQALSVAPTHRGALEYYGELKVERGDLAGARAHLARLEAICRFGCYEAEELRRWIETGPPVAG